MNWLLTEIAGALVVAALIGMALGLLAAWAYAGIKANRANSPSEMANRIVELEKRNLHLTESYKTLRLQSRDQEEIHLDTPRIA